MLLDRRLPDIDGSDVASEIRAMEKKEDRTAIVFLAGMSKDEGLAGGIDVGVATAMASKHRSLEMLVQTADHLVYQAKAQGRNRVGGAA